VLVWYQVLHIPAWSPISDFLFFSFSYQAGTAIRHFKELSYQSGIGIGSKTDFWLVLQIKKLSFATCLMHYYKMWVQFINPCLLNQ
jgi:hypothetical protein